MKDIKSINSVLNPTANFFNDEIHNYLLSEGFEARETTDSYTLNGENGYDLYDGPCYKMYIDDSSFVYNIYVVPNGIAIDKDYECGGNSSVYFIHIYNESQSSFIDGSNQFVEYINKEKS